MKTRLADDQLQKLSKIGQAFDIGRLPHVFNGGRVAFVEDLSEKDTKDEYQGTGGSAAGSRKGPEAGPRRTAGQAPRNGSLDLEAAYLAGLGELEASYLTQIFRVENGLWAVLKSKPLGNDGPQAHFVIGVPFLVDAVPRAWALWRIGKSPQFIGPRHTNFPDSSICAFGPNDGAWTPADGLRALADLYSTWLIRQLYFKHFRRWPGRQHGASALYRQIEFHSDEWCGCDSGRRYKDCHQPFDNLMSESALLAEHRKFFGGAYCDRVPPLSVISFVERGLQSPPPLEFAYANC